MGHWSERFLDFGYERGSEGPKNYDCWSFLRLVQAEQFGVIIPYMPTPRSLGAIARAMEPWARQFGWERVERPTHGDAVFLSAFREPTHVGTYVGDLGKPAVLHCPEGGAALHNFSHLEQLRWRVRGYFHFVGIPA